MAGLVAGAVGVRPQLFSGPRRIGDHRQYLAVSLSAADISSGTPARGARFADLRAALGQLLPRPEPLASWTRLYQGALRHVSGPPRAPQSLRPRPHPCAGLVVAGAWTDTGWPATMEGAVRSGSGLPPSCRSTSGCRPRAAPGSLRRERILTERNPRRWHDPDRGRFRSPRPVPQGGRPALDGAAVDASPPRFARSRRTTSDGPTQRATLSRAASAQGIRPTLAILGAQARMGRRVDRHTRRCRGRAGAQLLAHTRRHHRHRHRTPPSPDGVVCVRGRSRDHGR